MQNVPRPVPFILMSSNHGTMIVNRNDFQMINQNQGYGVGFDLLNYSSFCQSEVDFGLALIERRRINFGPGVMVLDCGANIGVHTVEWSRFMHGWGELLAFEAQERIFYALAGNIAINNCLNASARLCAVGSQCGSLEIPEPNYLVPSSYGSFELQKKHNTEYIGQEIDYKKTRPVPLVSIDSLDLKRLDFVKIDVEGMEEDVLRGAKLALKKHKPIMMIEIIKSDRAAIDRFLQDLDYRIYPMGMNILAIHAADPVTQALRLEGDTLYLS